MEVSHGPVLSNPSVNDDIERTCGDLTPKHRRSPGCYTTATQIVIV